jgi:hypothetical protein
VAGNGFQFFAGDGGPATQAALNEPGGVSVDANSNLYIADTLNNRIRKVTAAGVISTVAGNGQQGYSGDGGTAVGASLNAPAAVVPDAAGNLYICDLGNNVIRKVTSAGVISTVVGNGQFGYSGDGGPATAAALENPAGIGLDAAGNLYIADTLNNRIRVVDSSQRISTFAGNGVRGFGGDGDLATLASFGAPQGIWPAPSGDVFIADTRNNRIRQVLAVPPAFSVSATELTFAAPSDGEAPPEQDVGVSSPVTGVPFMAAVTTAGATWLRLDSPVSVTSGRLGVIADPTGIPAGTYHASLMVAAPNAQPAVRVVSVTFNVGSPLPAKLSVTPGGITFELTENSQPQTQTLTVSNSGSGPLDFLASASTLTGSAAWLSITTDSGTVRPGAAAAIAVIVDPGNLPPGSYNGLVSVASPTTGESIDIPVTLGVTAIRRKILLSQTGLAFTAVAGGGTAPQTFSVANDGLGAMSFTVGANVLSGGTWVAVTPDSGTADAAGIVASVEVQVDPSGLAPGLYYGQLRLDAPGADNSPQFVSVCLNVLPAGSNPGPALQPSSLTFTGVAGGPNPGSQTVLIYNTGATPVSFTSSRGCFQG